MTVSRTRAFAFAALLSAAAFVAIPANAASVGGAGGASSGGASSGGAGGGNHVQDLVYGSRGNCDAAIACVRVPAKPVVRSYSHCSTEVIERYYGGDRHACRRDLGL